MSHRKFRAPRHGSLGFLVRACLLVLIVLLPASSPGSDEQAAPPLFDRLTHCCFDQTNRPTQPPRTQQTAQEAHEEAPGQDPVLPQGRPEQAAPPNGLHGVQGRHDAHRPRGGPLRLQDAQEGGALLRMLPWIDRAAMTAYWLDRSCLDPF
jgi:hypothetical protein